MPDCPILGNRLRWRFRKLLEVSGWGTEELSALLGYGNPMERKPSKTSLMRWLKGNGQGAFRERTHLLIEVLTNPSKAIDSWRDKSTPDRSPARLEWFDPLDREGIGKLVHGILSEDDDERWMARLARCAPPIIKGRKRYQQISDASGDEVIASLAEGDIEYETAKAAVEMKLQCRQDCLAPFHARLYRAVQALGGGRDLELRTTGGHFKHAAEDPKQVIELDVPGEQDMAFRLVCGALAHLMKRELETPGYKPTGLYYRGDPDVLHLVEEL